MRWLFRKKQRREREIATEQQLAEMQNRNIDTRKKVDELERILQEISERKRARNDR